MAFIGSLEQFDLSNVLRRVEVFTKTGLLVVKQGEQWVEFYFRHGILVCIGPIRTDITLGDRLLHSGVITEQALREAIAAIEPSDLSEMRMALTLIDLGYVNQDTLYTWISKETTRVLQVLLSWSSGEIYFEDGYPPPNDRLLRALSVTTLLQSLSAGSELQSSAPVKSEGASVLPAASVSKPVQREQPVLKTGKEDASGLFSADRLLDDISDFSSAPGVISSEVSSLMADLACDSDSLTSSNCSLLPPQRVAVAPPPMYVDISFMQPTMVMMPLDLSTQRERNPQAALTPEQWRVFTKADGSTPLQETCQMLSMSRGQVCQIAGELTALGLIKVVMPAPVINELSPTSRDQLMTSMANGLLQPGYAASTVQPWSTAMPITDNLPDVAEPTPLETDSQWGNGGNGARFVLGGGWMLSSSPQPAPSAPSFQPAQPTHPFYASNRAYAHVGGR